MQLRWCYRFYSCLGTDRSEYRGWNIAMGSVEDARSSAYITFQELEGKAGGSGLGQLRHKGRLYRMVYFPP